MQISLYTVARDSLNVLVGAPFNVDLSPAMPSVTKAAEFFTILQSNLNAAALHAALSHEGPRFRDCPRSSCLDAVQMIPQLEGIGPDATDAEVNTVLDRVMAELEANLLQVTAAAVRM